MDSPTDVIVWRPGFWVPHMFIGCTVKKNLRGSWNVIHQESGKVICTLSNEVIPVRVNAANRQWIRRYGAIPPESFRFTENL